MATGGSGLGQQLLDHHLRLAVCTLAEVVMADTPLRVGEVEGGPVVVPEGQPHRVVVVGRDRVGDLHVLHGPADVTGAPLERELGCVDADHHQPVA
jgi:hypothetical protein